MPALTSRMLSVVLAVPLLLGLGACKKKGQDVSAADEFLALQVTELEAAIAKRDISGIFVGCAGESSIDRMPAAVATKVKRLCHVEAPRIYLEDAIKDATAARAKHPDLPASMTCMQLFVEEALKTVAAHPANDPQLTKLVDDYTKLCPEQVAKIRSKP